MSSRLGWKKITPLSWIPWLIEGYRIEPIRITGFQRTQSNQRLSSQQTVGTNYVSCSVLRTVGHEWKWHSPCPQGLTVFYSCFLFCFLFHFSLIYLGSVIWETNPTLFFRWLPSYLNTSYWQIHFHWAEMPSLSYTKSFGLYITIGWNINTALTKRNDLVH